jgi:putative PIN family toxin of toxin-antitoxin system
MMATDERRRIVLDTNVLVAAARSRRGASFALVSAIPSDLFVPCLSIGLYAEWQDVLSRPENLLPGRSADDARRFLRYLASQSELQEIYFLWRPFLPDADDDMVLELALAANCQHIIPHNLPTSARPSDWASPLALPAIFSN